MGRDATFRRYFGALASAGGGLLLLTTATARFFQQVRKQGCKLLYVWLHCGALELQAAQVLTIGRW
jgi:hypothetical protein